MGITNADFILSARERERYQEWVQKSAEEEPNLSSVTISFTFTPSGKEVVAYRQAGSLKKSPLVIRLGGQ